MCYHPITIINPRKVVSVKYHDRFLLQVPCGQCAECQQRKSLEWNFRTYYEFQRCFENNGFVYFDTLTYDDAHLPHMSEVLSELPNYSCFRSSDITKFLKRLRSKLERNFGIESDAFSYFICSEYGSLHFRPHYHILLFMRCAIDPLCLSSLVAQCWQCGRTDGIPYKGFFYVDQHNVIRQKRDGNIIACVKYVTKYIEKDCKLQSIIDKRLKRAGYILTNELGLFKVDSVAYKKQLTKLASEVNQFHLQSLHYGELALRDIDLSELVRTGSILMPSHEVKTNVVLPTYFARKLFYEKWNILNNISWQLSDDGKEFVKARQPYLLRDLENRFACLAIDAGVNVDAAALADYVLNHRGRYVGSCDESTTTQRLDNPTHFVYVSPSDKERIGCGISTDWLGCSSMEYAPFTSQNKIKIKDFISKYVYLNPDFENQLQLLYNNQSSINDGKQSYYARVQELKSKFKSLSMPLAWTAVLQRCKTTTLNY